MTLNLMQDATCGGGGASRHYVCVTEAKQSYLCFIVSGFRYNVHPLSFIHSVVLLDSAVHN